MLPVKYAVLPRPAAPTVDYVHENELVGDVRLMKSPREFALFPEGGRMVSPGLNKSTEGLIAVTTEAEAASTDGGELLRRDGYRHRFAIPHGTPSAHTESDPLYAFSGNAPRPGDICTADADSRTLFRSHDHEEDRLARP